MTSSPPLAAVIGLGGPVLADAERELLQHRRPAGVILFGRNCQDHGQLTGLIASIRDACPGWQPLLFIDQEGGRVARLRNPSWRAKPAAARTGAAGAEAVWSAARLIARDLADLGIDVDCAPVLDVAAPGMTDAIGDRAFCRDPERVADLGRAFLDGLAAGGVQGCIKHMPGHGRAVVDSHAELPVVDAPLDVLRRSDFVPFRKLADTPFGMTAHVLFRALDPDRPATLSKLVIERVIRGEIGFGGVLLTDDLAMNALLGAPADRAAGAIAAGCDLALYCKGDQAANLAVLEAVPPLSDSLLERLDSLRLAVGEAVDVAALEARLDDLVATAAA
ncbi:MAG: beta-N-acetylhexosaminidase [Geminicoccaceae bacterium]